MDRQQLFLVLAQHFLTYFCISLAITLGILVCLHLRRQERRLRELTNQLNSSSCGQNSRQSANK